MSIQRFHQRFPLLKDMQRWRVTGWKLILYLKRICKSAAEQLCIKWALTPFHPFWLCYGVSTGKRPVLYAQASNGSLCCQPVPQRHLKPVHSRFCRLRCQGRSAIDFLPSRLALRAESRGHVARYQFRRCCRTQ